MANDWYDGAVHSLMKGEIDLETADLRVILIDLADYTVDLLNHDFLDDVPAAARVAVSANLTGRTITNRTFDADDAVFTAPSGDVCEAVILYQHTGTDSTSRVMHYWDTSVPGLPVTPDGISDIEIPWAAAGIADLFAT